MIGYLLKSGILLAVFYIFYILVLRQLTFFKLNRSYLLVGVIFSLLLPIIPPVRFLSPEKEMSRFIEGITITNNIGADKYNKSLELINPLIVIYLGGMAWFILRLFFGLGKLVYLCLRFPSTRIDGKRTVVLEGNQAPFTFFNILFITNSNLPIDKDDSIIKHELAHIYQFHSIDLILLEFAVIVQWFNPFIWLIKRALKEEHEYAADDQVVKEGYNKLTYQQLLLEQTMGVTAMGLVNCFNNSLLKNRIKMMTKNKSGINTRLRYLLTLPMIVMICTVSLLDVNQVLAQDDQVYDKADVMPEFPGGMQEVRLFLAQHLIYPEIAKEQKVSGKIYVQFIVNEDGSVEDVTVLRTDIDDIIEGEKTMISYSTPEELKTSPKKEGITALKEEAIRVVNSLPEFTPGLIEGKPVKVRFTFPINFALE